MNLIEKSLEIALTAYSGKKDKAGKPYILHPIRLMTRMKTDEEMAAALLHDVIEDSEISEKDLINNSIPPKVVDAVSSLTRLKNERYENFINRILNNPLACKIKKADIEDNLNILRLKSLNDEDLKRVARYHRAWVKLNG